MLDLTASGDIYNLDGQAGFDEGIVGFEVGGNSRLSFEGELQLCHGVNAAVYAEIRARLFADLGLFWLISGRGDAQASAAAGVRARLRLNPDLFDTFGLSAEMAAFAEAAVAARLSLSLDVREIAKLALPALPAAAYDVLVAFLNETEIGGGAWLRLYAAAAAKAHFNIKGSLKDDDNAGFVIEHGADVAGGTGGGAEFYIGMRLKSPKRFFLYASERITEELARDALRLLTPSLHPLVNILKLALPITFITAYELGQRAILQNLATPEKLVQPFIDTFTGQLQRFCLDRMVEAGAKMLGNFLEDLVFRGLSPQIRNLSRSERDHIVAGLQASVAALEAGDLTLPRLERILPGLVDALTPLTPANQIAQWRRPLTITWAAFAIGETLRGSIRPSSRGAAGTVSVIGLGPIARGGGQDLFLPALPQFVRDDIEEVLGALSARPQLADAIDYLIRTGAARELDRILPELAPALNLVAVPLNITPGVLVEDALRASLGRGLDQLTLYHRLRDALKQAIDDSILGRIIPELQIALPRNHESRIWIDEAARPSLLLMSNFAFQSLDRLVAGGFSGIQADQFFNSFRAGLSHVISKLVVRNVVVIADIILDHFYDNISQTCTDLAAIIRRDPRYIVNTSASTLLAPMLPPGVLPTSSRVQKASRELLAATCQAVGEAYGPSVWTTDRHNELRRLYRHLLLSIDGALDFADQSAVAKFFRQLAECAFVPDLSDLQKLADFHLALLKDQAAVMIRRVPPALSEFYSALGDQAVALIDGAVRQALAELRHRLNEAEALLRVLERDLERYIEELERAVRAAADHLASAQRVLRSNSRRDEVVNAWRRHGVAEAERMARAAFGFNQLSHQLQRDAIALAISGFAFTFDGARLALDAGLATFGNVADVLGEALDTAADLPDLIRRVARLVEREVRAAVNDALGPNLALPKELSLDDLASLARETISALPALRDALAAALAARDAEREARQREREAGRKRALQAARVASHRNEVDEMISDALSVHIVSPAPIADQPSLNWAYGPTLTARVSVRGAKPAFIEPNKPKRIYLALNGQELAVPSGRWVYSTTAGSLSLTLPLNAQTDSLRPGLNALVCSVSGGREEPVRARALFAVNPVQHADRSVTGALAVVRSQSDFRAPSAAPLEVAAEKITLRNPRQASLKLLGWRLLDRSGTVFVFPNVTLAAGKTITVYTAPFPAPVKGRLTFGQAKAIWNRAGDVVYVVDDRGLLVTEFVYGTVDDPRDGK